MEKVKALTVACPRCGAAVGIECTGLNGTYRETHHAARSMRARVEFEFWACVDSRLADLDCRGLTEQEFLDRIALPGWTGRKARTNSTAPRVISMPVRDRDRKRAAAGDFDDAA